MNKASSWVDKTKVSYLSPQSVALRSHSQGSLFGPVGGGGSPMTCMGKGMYHENVFG